MDLCVGIPTSCLHSVLNVKALVGTFNQEKAFGAFSVIMSLCLDLRFKLYIYT